MWSFGLKKKQRNQENTSLTDIVRGIQWAVNSAIQSTENQYIATLQKFFEKQEDGSFKAVEVDIGIDDNHFMRVPLISLVNPNGLILKKMGVEMVVKIDRTQVKNIYKEDTDEESDVTRSSFNVSFSSKNKAGSGDVIKLNMEFEATESPEGVSRILEQLTNNIQPHKKIATEEVTGDAPENITENPPEN